MKKWVCTVCGYIHEGEEPPETCPVCGADKSMFEEVIEDAADQSETSSSAKADQPALEDAAAAAALSDADLWECTVCGTRDGGETPPAECPVCGADQSLFKNIGGPSSKTDATSPPPSAAKNSKPKTGPKGIDLGPEPASFSGRMHYRIVAQMLKHHAHPMTVHVPNGVIPFCFIFILLAAVSGCRALAIAAQCNMIFVVLAMPVVLYSGYVEWQKRYKGFPSNRFIVKIICATIVAASSVGVVVWWWIDPAVVQNSPAGFILINFIMLAAAVIAGLIGGKLVFKD